MSELPDSRPTPPPDPRPESAPTVTSPVPAGPDPELVSTTPYLPVAEAVLAALQPRDGAVPYLRLPDTPTAAGSAATLCAAAAPDGVGRYRIFGEIAHGGMGAIFKGQDLDLGRDLAFKVLLDKHQDNPAIVQRFVEEAQIGGQLQHPGIVPVHELGRFADGRLYFTMKLVQGRTLAALLKERRDPSQDRSRFLTICEQVCQTLAYAHSRKVVHRDLKPQNIMVGAFGEVQVMDWGLAKVLSGEGAEVSRPPELSPTGPETVRTVRTATTEAASASGSVLGTYEYMAPEQARGEVDRLDERCDVFALGGILCEVLTGRPPYVGESRSAVHERAIAADLGDALARLQTCGADPELLALARDCLAVAPQDRPRNAGAVADRLAAYLASVQERLRGAELAAAAAQARAEQEHKARLAESRARRLTLALATAVLVVVLLGGGGWWYLASSRAERQAATEQATDEALREATRLLEQARAAPPGDRAHWTEAVAAARRAEGLLAGGEGSTRLRRRVEALLAELEQEERDRRMVARLEEIRLAQTEVKDGQFNMTRADPDYAAAFKDYGIDVRVLPPAEAAARLRARSVKSQLAAALDHWASLRRKNPRADPATWRRLLHVARLTDPDPWRNRLRDTLVQGDRRTLRRLARSADVAALPASTLYQLGETLAELGDRAEAVRWLRQAQRKHPGDFWINHQLAFRLHRLQPPQWDEAIRFYTAALALRQGSPGVHNNLGIALLNRGLLDQAAAAFREAIRLQPDYAQAHNNLGIALRLQGRLGEAVAACRQAIRLRKDYAHAHHHLGTALYRQGRWDRAEASLRRALALNPVDPETHFVLGNVLHSQNRLDQAIAEFQRAIRLKPDHGPAHTNLGTVYHRQGKRDEAAAAYRRAIAIDPKDGRAHYNLTVVLQERGSLDQAIAAGREALRWHPDMPEIHYVLGGALEAAKKLDRAADSYRQAIRFRPAYGLALDRLGVVLAEQGHFQAAGQAFAQLVRLEPKNALAHYNLGFTQMSRGLLAEAVASFRQVLRLTPEYTAAHCNLGLALMRQGRFAEARPCLRRGHELALKDPHWTAPTGKWLSTCDHFLELEKRLPAILKGSARPARVGERLDFALMCRYKRLVVASARLYEEAFQSNPEVAEDRKSYHRTSAARAAALAGCGEGEDAAGLDEVSRARLRQQALVWLRADLASLSRLFDRGPKAVRRAVCQVLRQWQRDPAFTGLREATALAKLPGTEREAWRRFWADVKALRDGE
jgi:serine/threonine-protein kinase